MPKIAKDTPLSEITGKVSVAETDEGYTVTVTSQDIKLQE